jgi:hypothetical protein
MPSKLTVTAVFLIGLLSVALYMAIDIGTRAGAERDALRGELAKANTQLDRARKGAQRAAREAQEARQELDYALKSNPAWSAESVPAAVVDSLCQRIRCTKPGSVPAPAGER